jgi:hypothetical protein
MRATMPNTKDLTQRLAEEKEWRDRNNEVKAKIVNYDFLTEEQKRDPKILPFIYKKPFEEELKEFDKRKDETRNSGIKGQIKMVMSPSKLRRFYGGYLVPFGYREEDLMRMPMKDLEDLFNRTMEWSSSI